LTTSASTGTRMAGPTTATAAPAATQRSCWRSTPAEARNRSTTQPAAAGMEANSSPQPTQETVVASWPATPGSPNGLATGTRVWVIGCGDRTQPTTSRVVPTMLAAATIRQRGERSRPSGSNSSGRVTPRAIAGAHSGSVTAA
jgi:hypothetical protein